MNFLQITQRLRRKCRVTGTGPTTVIGQSEEYARLVDFVNESWMTLQRKRRDWWWMRNSMTFPTVAGQASYTLAQIEATGTGFSDFGNWCRDQFRNYPTATGQAQEMFMNPISHNEWRDIYQYGTNRTTEQRPQEFAILPSQGIGLGPTPAVGYTVTGDYFKVPTEMVLDADIPALPSQFHMAIVYGAMMLYGVSESSPEIYDEGNNSLTAIMREIEDHQLPEIEVAGALA